MKMMCVETGRVTKIENENDTCSWHEQIVRAATRLIRREPEWRRGNYFVSPQFKEFSAKIGDEMDAEIRRPMHTNGLTECTGEKRTFRLVD
jgi:hypothetical protein